MAHTTTEEVAAFIAYWSKAEASERANSQSFLLGLAKLLEVPEPTHSHSEGYSFEFPVKIPTGPAAFTDGFIDLYKKGCFVLESKQFVARKEEQSELELAALAAGAETAAKRKSGPVRGSEAWDDAMWKARGQAERYARSLPGDHPNAPFLLVVDVGHSIEVFADFTQAGRSYQAFPDPRSFRIRLADLAEEKVRDRLRRIWTDPVSLDPAKISAEVTREIAGYLATLASSLEEAGHTPKIVAEFLTRCLFCMFAEDVGLLRKDAFRNLLESLRPAPEGFVPKLKMLFAEMQTGTDYSVILNQKLLRFNGGLFEDASVLPLNGMQLGILIQAAAMQWKDVEPAIFGTLLERALDPIERHQLGAHYTPRAYVERLVLPTIVEPLRAEWESVRAAALVHAKADRLSKAREEVRKFHDHLCNVTVLDPACGSGNFLYVTLEHLKRLEGEVLEAAAAFGENLLLDLSTHTVDPHQFLGIELNPRAAAITELVLWIGYLQWHFRTRGDSMPAEPVLKKFRNIECRDAVLAWDGEPQPQRDEHGQVVTVWNRRSMKTDLVTGRDVPDESRRVPLLTYPNARQAVWPKADYIVGNPPFIGTTWMRENLGDGYTETLRSAYPGVPESADFVMYWWDKAARSIRRNSASRFGLITTNSLRQTFNRRVVQCHLDQQLVLVFAIPDHPWVDTADGAAVRIAMTVGTDTVTEGRLLRVTDETSAPDGSVVVSISESRGRIDAGLTIGADVAGAPILTANANLSSPGVKLHGSGFIVSPGEAKKLGLGTTPELDQHIREYRNGKDLTNTPRGVLVIDLFGLKEAEVRERFPAVYQHVLTTVKPERDANNRDTYRKMWWVFGEPRRELRPALAGLRRYIVTVETAKHRIFQFLGANVLPDNKLIVIALEDAFHLGVLSSRLHLAWVLAQGALLEDRPVYPKTECFDPFPFPSCDEETEARIRSLGEELDAHRKRVQAANPKLSLTAMYNVLEALRAGRRLTPKEQAIHEQGQVSILREIHDKLDVEVLQAYSWGAMAHEFYGLRHGNTLDPVTGWPVDKLADPTAAAAQLAAAWAHFDQKVLTQLVALNAERAAEEAAGNIRWLRPEYQAPQGTATQGALNVKDDEKKTEGTKAKKGAKAAKPKKQAWPKTMAERVRAVEQTLKAAEAAMTAEEVAKKYFTRAKAGEVAEILDTLVTLGHAHQKGEKFGI